MRELKCTVIKSKKQYNKYCNTLEELLQAKNKNNKDEIELLTLLIEKWDSNHNSFEDVDTVELLKSLMEANNLRPKEFEILKLKGTVSKILNYHKGFSKETIRKLSEYFKISQEAFNRPYKQINKVIKRNRNVKLKTAKRKLNTLPN